MKKDKLTPLRKEAMDASVGKRAHLYEKEQVGVRNYTGPMNMIIPIIMFKFTLHPECTRAIYKAKKKALKRKLRRRSPSPKKNSFFTSRKGISNCQPVYRPRPTDAEVTARLRKEAYGHSNN